jgi:photosystem II stability/assembly factor-like uncharacterized protein
MRTIRLLLSLILTAPLAAQWQMQTSNTTADLRGIHNVGNGVAWASGTNGTVLRTEDGGYVWQTCAIPPGAEKLDFRGIQGFDANTAIVMSSGKGELSRLYKTTDGCHTWKLVFTNPDPEGFWDTFRLSSERLGLLVGDPVIGKFPLFWIVPAYARPNNCEEHVKARAGEAAFAASNTSLFVYSENFWLATGGAGGARVIRRDIHGADDLGWVNYPASEVPVGQHTDSSGIFSIAFAQEGNPRPSEVKRGVAVGGDYLKPGDSSRTSAFTLDGGRQWHSSQTPPHGYRSSVAYDEKLKTWITVGPNGTDISTDDGKNWRAVHPNADLHEAPDADRNWNAISLPYVVGPKGRIGKLDEGAIK